MRRIKITFGLTFLFVPFTNLDDLINLLLIQRSQYEEKVLLEPCC